MSSSKAKSNINPAIAKPKLPKKKFCNILEENVIKASKWIVMNVQHDDLMRGIAEANFDFTKPEVVCSPGSSAVVENVHVELSVDIRVGFTVKPGLDHAPASLQDYDIRITPIKSHPVHFKKPEPLPPLPPVKTIDEEFPALPKKQPASLIVDYD